MNCDICFNKSNPKKCNKENCKHWINKLNKKLPEELNIKLGATPTMGLDAAKKINEVIQYLAHQLNTK